MGSSYSTIQAKNIGVCANLENYMFHTHAPPTPFPLVLFFLLLVTAWLTCLSHIHLILLHTDYFTTQLEIDVLRSSGIGWKWLSSGLLIPVLHCFQASDGVFVEFTINDIFFNLAVYFLASHALIHLLPIQISDCWKNSRKRFNYWP